MRSRAKTRRRIRMVLPVLLYGWPIAASYLRHPRPSINLRERTTYVPDLVCPPTSVITFASVTTLRRYLRKDTCARTLYALEITSWRRRRPPSSIPCRSHDLSEIRFDLEVVATSGIVYLLRLLSLSESVTLS